jgi:hypothetical protein
MQGLAPGKTTAMPKIPSNDKPRVSGEIVHGSALSHLSHVPAERVTARMASAIGLSHVSQLS